MRCGHCPLATAISRHAGGSSRRHSHAGCALPSAFRPAARVSANAAPGNAASGRRRSATMAISLDTWITLTSIRSSTATSSASKIGRFHRSTVWCGSAATRPNRRSIPAMSRKGALAKGDGFRFAQPILRTLARDKGLSLRSTPSYTLGNNKVAADAVKLSLAFWKAPRCR
jgi:hypothetical protein